MRHLLTLFFTLNVILNLFGTSSASSSPPKTRDFLRNFGKSGQHSNHAESSPTSTAGSASPERQPPRTRERSPGRELTPNDIGRIDVKITDWVPEDAWYESRYGFRKIRRGEGVRIFEGGGNGIGRIDGDYIAPIYTSDHKFLCIHKASNTRFVFDNIEDVKKYGVGLHWFPLLQQLQRNDEEEEAEEQRNRNNRSRD